MRLPVRCLSIAACVAGFAGAVHAEQVDNPAYTSWAKYKPGTTVTYKQSMEMAMPMAMPSPQMTITEKLVEVKPEAVVLEVSSETVVMGQTHTMPPRQQQVPAKIDKEKMGVPPNVKGEVKDMKEGKEKVEVNGKSVDATTREMTVVATEPRPMTAHVKVWQAEEVPGGMVKTVSDIQEPMKATSTMVLADYKVVK
ncbi:MAG: hypothetical protein ACTHN5_04205 [Phycisphaerae bacterium]